MDQRKAKDILEALESFRRLERKATDETGWIALRYSVSRQEAERMIHEARKMEADL